MSSSKKKLTKDLVFTKTKSDSLQNIKNLNLWGNDLEDLGLIEEMPNLEVVSLSVNRISTLRDFSKCPKLQELYLRKNSISDLNQIQHLIRLPNLKVLWLHDNPCAQLPNYREIVIKHLPNLMKLDNNPVSSEERILSQNVNVQFDKQPPSKSLQVEEDYQYRPATQESKWSKKSNYNQKVKPTYDDKSKSGFEDKPRSNIRQTEVRQQPQYSPKRELPAQSPPPVDSGLKVNQIQRNQNILMAVLSLMHQLDPSSLEIVKREAEKMIYR